MGALYRRITLAEHSKHARAKKKKSTGTSHFKRVPAGMNRSIDCSMLA